MSEKKTNDPAQPGVETDPRFPSGAWVGFWIQRGIGKQKMSLSLSFIYGNIQGSGVDIVGRFNFAGTYQLKTGKVLMTKQYEKAHRVEYNGANQGDGQWLWGVWNIGSCRGGWHLWPEGEADPTQQQLKATNELPKPHRLKRGELIPAGEP